MAVTERRLQIGKRGTVTLPRSYTRTIRTVLKGGALLSSDVSSAKQKISRRQPMKNTEKRVQLGRRGTITLPAGLRERYGLDAGDALTVVDLGGVFVLTPEVSVVSKIAQEVNALRDSAGVTLDDLLEGLDEERRAFYAERYGTSD